MRDDDRADSVSTPLARDIRRAIADAGGWLPFERFMALALYAPGLGYYARGERPFGLLPGSGSDFVTAPELSPRFGRALARQLVQLLDATGSDELWEFGAGSGALAAQLLDVIGPRVRRYTIVDVSSALVARQRQLLSRFGDRVRWLQALPERIDGVVVGNEVLDAMPVQLIAFDGARWHERGVVAGVDGGFAWSDRETTAHPPVEAAFVPGTVTELHRHARAFVSTLAARLRRGAALFIDYGFPAAEYYHVQRVGGTLMCHRGHRADTDPLRDVGGKDITAHVDFTAIALAAQDAGCEVFGYASQAAVLINCGLVDELRGADARTIADAQKLLNEHEMGELFKVIAFGRGLPASLAPIGFARGDRTHTL
jgi:SAM-dependent MidA family methyltransferase